ncbi:MAG: protein kinase [Thermoanaerobaculia bacterium]
MSSSLRTGTILGSYRIIAPLGAGGMGEVYSAHDAKLDRIVALKILPEAVVRDAERVRRFVQEAKSASSLSHPNIVTIHDIGEAVPVEAGTTASDSAADGVAVHYIAMELVEGSTLRQLFADRTIEPRTLLVHLAQAAEGLAKAHVAGIVHRDLKPENIMVTRDGYAKVLDFGLAKLTEKGVSGSALAAAPTAFDEQTREGAVMGTVGYMSPEQAMGKPVDHRTDLFAFGCLLYEAATGVRPFTGESNVDVLHAIVREKPKPVEEIAPEVPRVLVRAIRRCLAKDPDRRYQSMKDLALELHEMVDEWETLAAPSGPVSSTTASSTVSALAPVRGGLGRTGWIAIAAGGLALVVAALIAWRGSRATPSVPNGFQEMRIRAATSTGNILAASLSPDGRYLASVREEVEGLSLWLRQLATGTDIQLLPPQGLRSVRSPVFTPDGEYVTFTESDDRRSLFSLYRIPVLGGTARKLLDDIDTLAAYSPDGSRIAFVRNLVLERSQTVFLASAEGEDETPLATRRTAEGHQFFTGSTSLGPVWSPDGRSVTVPGLDRTAEYRSEMVNIDVASGAEQRIGSTVWLGLSGVNWLPDGRALVVAGTPTGGGFQSQVWRVGYPGGELTRITNDSQSYSSISVRKDGHALAVVQGQASSTLWRKPLGGAAAAAGARQLTRSSRDLIQNLAGREDGWIYYDIESAGVLSIQRIPTEGGEPFTLSRPENPAVQPDPSRDGRAILCRTLLPDGRLAVRLMDRDGTPLRDPPARGVNDSYAMHPDGTWYLFYEGDGFWRQPLDGTEATKFCTARGATAIGFSRSGDRLAFLEPRSTGDGAFQSWIVVVDATTGKHLAEVELPRGLRSRPRWAPDGQSFVFSRQEGEEMSLWRLPLAGRPLERIADLDPETADVLISPDGKTLFYTILKRSSDAVLIEGF